MSLKKKHPILPQFSMIHQLDFVEFYLDESKKVIMVKYREGVLIDLKKAKQLVDFVYPYIKAGAVCGLTDATEKNIDITTEARSYYSHNKSMDATIVQALVIKDLYLRILAKLFVTYDKPTSPFKVYNSLEKAYQFLLNYESEFVADKNSSKVPSL